MDNSGLLAEEQGSKKKKSSKKELNLQDRALSKIDLRLELRRLEEMLNDLKVDYEQYFMGITLYSPDKLHKEVKRQIRHLRKAPFKKPWASYKLRSLEGRYHTFNDYWQRVIRQKEEGTYHKDVFKANLREKNQQEDMASLTAQGKVSKQVAHLYDSYKRALEKQLGRKQEIDFKAFQKSLRQQAKAYQEKFGDKKLQFKVVVQEGRVKIKASTKDAGSK